MMEAVGNSTLEKLKSYVHSALNDENKRVFFSIDGSYFPSLPEQLSKYNIAHRPLYKNNGNLSVVIGGPWIVTPYMPHLGEKNIDESILLKLEENISLEEKALILASHMDEAIKRGDRTDGGLLQVENFYDINSAYQQIMNFLNILPELTGIVVWIGDQSATWDKLYDHLRRLNRIWIPKKYARRSLVKELAKSAPTVYGNFNQEYLDFVLFRHSDANVLAQILPSLEPIKKKRFIGGFQEVCFCPSYPWGQEIMRMKNSPNVDSANSNTPLFLSINDMEAMEKKRFEAINQIFAQKLKQEYPETLKSTNDKELFQKVHDYSHVRLS